MTDPYVLIRTHKVIWRTGGTAKWQWHKSLDTYTEEQAITVAHRIAALGYETRIVRAQDVNTSTHGWSYDLEEIPQ